MNESTSSKWVINGLLLVIVVLLGALYLRAGGMKSAHAAGEGWATDGVVATSTNGNLEALIMVDTQKQQILVYRSRSNDFKLIGARSYKYDVEIEDSTVVKPPIAAQGWTYVEAKKTYDENQSKK